MSSTLKANSKNSGSEVGIYNTQKGLGSLRPTRDWRITTLRIIIIVVVVSIVIMIMMIVLIGLADDSVVSLG